MDLCSSIVAGWKWSRMDLQETKLFRSQETWSYLQSHGLSHVVPRGRRLRAWIAGCGDGEAVYSLAIALAELGVSPELVTIYATDSHDQAVAATRAGLFKSSALSNLSPDCRQRYFSAQPDGSFKICETLRDCVVCGRHDLIEDPPLSQLDLLIWERAPESFDPGKQEQLLGRFYWALRSKGVLILSTATSTSIAAVPFGAVAPGLPIFVPQHRRKTSASPRVRSDWRIEAGSPTSGKPLEALIALSSTQEELETSLESLKLTNEELEVAGEELRERQTQLDALLSYQRMVLSSIGLGIIVLDPCARVTTWNRTIEQLFALRETEALGRDFFSLDLGFATRDLEEPLNAVVQGRSHLEHRCIDTRDSRGRGLRLAVRLSPLRGHLEEVLGATLLVEDLAKRSRGDQAKARTRTRTQGTSQ
jgi:PAS domain S-box-containing protein